MNKVMLIGYVGKDPEVRFSGELQFCSFSLATSEKIKGEKKTEWHNIKTVGKLAEICGQYLHKGSQCCVVGKIQSREYESKGVTKRVTEIFASEVEFVGGQSDRQSKPATHNTHNTQKENYDYGPPPMDEDVPF